jgi:type I restriction enzyme S subunit
MELVAEKYKQTEVGLIPCDWEVKTLGDVGEVKMCRRIFNSETSPNGIIPFFKIGTFGKEPDAYISNEQYDEYRKRFSFPRKGDILISAAGTIGRTIIYNGQDAYFQDSNIVWIENDFGTVSNEFLYHIYQVANYNTEGGTIQRLYNSILKATKFKCPPMAEQTAIATALSDADALISGLEKLIAKKRNIKQGAMQKLLKPKEGWEVKKLGDVVEIRKGQLITENTRVNGNIPVIAGGKAPAYYHNKANRNGKTITISGSGASAGYVAFHNYPIFASDCSTIEEHKNYSIEYVFYLMQLLQDKIYKMQTGGAQPHIHPSDLNPIEVSFPKKEKQEEIATILSDMDAEISALETKLEKYRKVKLGMMQNLLTGKIRLI